MLTQTMADRLDGGSAAADGDVREAAAEIVNQVAANGMRVVVIEDHAEPAVFLRVLLPRGDNDDPPGKAGLADLTSELVLKGAGDRDAHALAELVDGLGASLVGESSAEYTVVGMNALAMHVDTALEILRDVVLAPRFDKHEFGLIQDQMAAGIKAQRSSPSYLASIRIAPAVYGSDAPQGMVKSEESVNAIALDDARAFHQRGLQSTGAIALCIGDIRAADIAARLQDLFRNLKSGAATDLLTAIPDNRSAGRVIEVEKKDLTQTTVMIGRPGPGRLSPDFFSAMVANYVLGGGGFISRLMEAVRTHGGKTYGIRSAISTGATPDLFSVKSSTRNEELVSSLTLTHDVWRKFIAEGPTDTEVSEAKDFFKGYFFLQTETPAQRAAKILVYLRYGLGIEEIDRYAQRIDAVTRASAHEAARRYLSADHLTACLVGPPDVTSKGKASWLTTIQSP